MITGIVVAILGFLLALVLYKLAQPSRPALPPGPARKQIEDIANLTAAQAQVGDALSITGAGDDFTDLDFTVDRKVRYTAGQRRWSEIGGMYRNRRVHLEVEEDEDNGLEVWAAVDPKKMTLEELGLSEDDLAAMDERQNTGDHFSYGGQLWYYRFSREVTATPDGASRQGPAQFYCWRFEQEGGKNSLIIRKPEGEPFAGEIGSKVNPGDIRVFRAK